MKKFSKGCCGWTRRTLVVFLTLTLLVATASFCFIFSLTLNTGIVPRLIIDMRIILNALRELSLDETGRQNQWMLWPHTSELGTCPTSTAFLRRLQKGPPPIETLFPLLFEDMPTCPDSVASERCFFRKNGESRWTILVDPSDSTPDFVPLILSSSIDVSVLSDLLAGKQLASRESRLINNSKDERGVGVLWLQNKGTVFLTNRSFGEEERARTMHSKFGGTSPSYTATYLTPTGLVTVTFRSQ